MGQRRTKKEIIDWIIVRATIGGFVGDKRDGKKPPITIETFTIGAMRSEAKLWRAQLSRQSLAEVLTVADNVEAYFKAPPSWLARAAKHFKQEEAAQARRERQAELGHRHGLQPAILAAARDCRKRQTRAGKKTNAGMAWDALAKAPFTASDGSIVEIVDAKLPRPKQLMRVISPDKKQPNRPIKFSWWRKRYWATAKRG